MKKSNIYKLAKQLGINKSDIDNVFIKINEKPRISTITADIYKGGTHYGTISIKEII